MTQSPKRLELHSLKHFRATSYTFPNIESSVLEYRHTNLPCFFFDISFFFQVNVSIESHASEEVSEGDNVKLPTVMAALVEPYQGRTQLKGMRVRAKLAGAGSGETTK